MLMNSPGSAPNQSEGRLGLAWLGPLCAKGLAPATKNTCVWMRQPPRVLLTVQPVQHVVLLLVPALGTESDSFSSISMRGAAVLAFSLATYSKFLEFTPVE